MLPASGSVDSDDAAAVAVDADADANAALFVRVVGSAP